MYSGLLMLLTFRIVTSSSFSVKLSLLVIKIFLYTVDGFLLSLIIFIRVKFVLTHGIRIIRMLSHTLSVGVIHKFLNALFHLLELIGSPTEKIEINLFQLSHQCSRLTFCVFLSQDLRIRLFHGSFFVKGRFLYLCIFCFFCFLCRFMIKVWRDIRYLFIGFLISDFLGIRKLIVGFLMFVIDCLVYGIGKFQPVVNILFYSNTP